MLPTCYIVTQYNIQKHTHPNMINIMRKPDKWRLHTSWCTYNVNIFEDFIVHFYALCCYYHAESLFLLTICHKNNNKNSLFTWWFRSGLFRWFKWFILKEFILHNNCNHKIHYVMYFLSFWFIMLWSHGLSCDPFGRALVRCVSAFSFFMPCLKHHTAI